MSSNELYHYGVLGMKWGVRRKNTQGYATVRTGLKNARSSMNDAENTARENLKKKKTYTTVRKDKSLNKLNRLESKSRLKEFQYAKYESNFKASDRGAQRNLSPGQYGRWVTSGARQSQQLELHNRKKAAERAKKKTQKYIDQLNSKYILSYDVISGTYSLKER